MTAHRFPLVAKKLILWEDSYSWFFHLFRSTNNDTFVMFMLQIVLFSLPSIVFSQAEVPAVFATPEFPAGNVDSCAVWVAPHPEDSLLFVTEKDGDRIEVWRAATGKVYPLRPFLGGIADGSGPGEFDRPNGVWVLYHVPFAQGFQDILLVTDQNNDRVQIIRLPELEYFGEFGNGQVGKGYGISWYQDGTDFFVYISDEEPPDEFPGKIKKYRLRPDGNRLGADFLFGFGSSGGEPNLSNVESIGADYSNNRLHVCGDEGGDRIYVFRLDGNYTDIDYGEPEFQNDQEGINIYDTGEGQGYLVVSDQFTNGSRNEFEVFNRVSLASLGYFKSKSGDPIRTENTDGAYLEQRPIPGLPNGAFYAVNDDKNVHVYDWTDIAQAMNLDIVALDRPFPGAPPGTGVASGVISGDAPSRKALWFHDGSWWGTLVKGESLTISRLEDGTFLPIEEIDVGAPASVWEEGDDLALLVANNTPKLHSFEYQASLRRYSRKGEAVDLDAVEGPLADFIVEVGPHDPLRGWIAWVAEGEVHLLWSLPGNGASSLEKWDAEGIVLGDSLEVLPQLVLLSGATGLLWADPGGTAFRVHLHEDPPETWTAREVVDGARAAFLSAAISAGGKLVVLGSSAGGDAWIRGRDPAGTWSGRVSLGNIRQPALVVNDRSERIYLFHTAEVSGHQVVQYRQGNLENLTFDPDRFFLGWPGVNLGPLSVPASLPEAASDLIIVSLGDDGLGHFARLPLSPENDIQPPITLQHFPPPGTKEIEDGMEIFFRITDGGAGVDRSRLVLSVNDQAVQPLVRGVPGNYLVKYALPAGLPGPSVKIRIEARDLAVPPNVMRPFEYDLFLGPREDPRFIRGDANVDGSIDISDVIKTLFAIFFSPSPLFCSDTGDLTDDGDLDVSDTIFLLAYLFLEGAAPPDPSPECGEDPTADFLPCQEPPICKD